METAETTSTIGTMVADASGKFTSAMGDVANGATGILTDAIPYILGVVAVGIIIAVGLKAVKKFKG